MAGRERRERWQTVRPPPGAREDQDRGWVVREGLSDLLPEKRTDLPEDPRLQCLTVCGCGL